MVHRAQRRFPPHEPQRVAAHGLDPARVEQAGRGVEVADEALPRGVVDRDHGLRAFVAFDDADRPVGGHVREHPGRGADRERPDPDRVTGGEGAVAGREPAGELLPVELLEVDGPVVRQHLDHGENRSHAEAIGAG